MAQNKELVSFFVTAKNNPDQRKELLNKAAEAFTDGKHDQSIYYQVRSLFSMLQDCFFRMPDAMKKENSKHKLPMTELQLNDNVITNDKLVQYALEKLNLTKDQTDESHDEYSGDFLNGISDPLVGFIKIINICKQFPDEWTVLQICKGPRPQTTYSIADHIHERDGDIYLTLLRHARSSQYPAPICLRFSDQSQVEFFKIFSKISKKCKEYMQVNASDVLTHEDKAKYWENLKALDRYIRQAITKLKQYLFPWLFLFKGIPRSKPSDDNEKLKITFKEVDKLCDSFQLALKQRVLLSLACMHCNDLDNEEIEAICSELTSNSKIQAAMLKLMLQSRKIEKVSFSSTTDKPKNYLPKTYPCILIVDEQLDHFYWEELNVTQEICRVNSLHCLWKLYTNYKTKIRNGYLCVNITKGGCVLNPDNNLPKMEMRLRAFFEYWTPSWLVKCNEKPTIEELMNDFFKRNCYVYAGHGSGLQHISGKKISRQKIEAVVFLFGCDSTRMHPNGLYSDLIGPHIYYQAALCACLVGAILPALDSQMDNVAVELLSSWIAPDSGEANWQQIDETLWMKKGIIEKSKNPKKEESRIGSLCGVLTRIHARSNEKYYYNTVPYICRGLPVWNCDVQPLPE